MAGERKGSFQASKNKLAIFWSKDIRAVGKPGQEHKKRIESLRCKNILSAWRIVGKRNKDLMDRVIYYDNTGVSQTLIK